MCMAQPREIYKIKTIYRTQIYDICDTYSPAHCICICLYIYNILIYVELWLFYNNDFVYHYGCHLPSRHWWKLHASCAYTNCKMRWSQGLNNGAWGIRILVLFWMFSLLCLFWCFDVTPASNSRELIQPAPLAGLGCIRVKLARRPYDAGLTIVIFNANMQFPRLFKW